MTDQKSLELVSKFIKPRKEGNLSFILREKEYGQNYVIYRIKLSPIEVSEVSRDEILNRMDLGKNFIQLGDCTVMLNSIASIDPLPKKNQEVKKRVNEMKKQFGME